MTICAADDCLRTDIEGFGYCSKHYQRFKDHGDIYHTRPSGAERFWSKILITADPNRCWNWNSRAVARRGYGKIGWGIGSRQTKMAHHVAWFLTHGTWPKDCLLHSCDNVKCVNPRHLREGSRTDNAQDREEKGHTLRGEGHPSATLTEPDILRIRELYLNGVRLTDIVREYQKSFGCIRHILTRRTWKHI